MSNNLISTLSLVYLKNILNKSEQSISSFIEIILKVKNIKLCIQNI